MYVCVYIICAYLGIIEEREFEERTTKDFFIHFFIQNSDGKKTDTTDINTLRQEEENERVEERERERERDERKKRNKEMRGRLFSPKQPTLLSSSSSSSSSNQFVKHLRSRDTLLTLSLFALSLFLFALPNFLLSDVNDGVIATERAMKMAPSSSSSLAPQRERDSEGRARPQTTTTPRRASSSSPSGGKKSGSSSSSSSSSSNANNNEQRASDGGIYRRMYNLTEPDVDETIKGTLLDVKVALDALPRIEIDPKILPTGLHLRDAFITQSNAKKFRFDTLPKRYLAADFDAIKLRFKDVDSKLSDSSCALVGSSGNVVGRNFASAIESHDSVVRLNQAPADSSLKSSSRNKHTETKDVGERSNFRALSKPWIHKYSLPEKGGLSPADLPLEWGANLILTGATKGITLQSVGLAQALREKWRRTDVQLIVVTPRMEAAARDFFQLYRWKLEKMGFTLKTKGTQPSVGFVAAFALMQVCDRVSLYGFGRTHSDGSKLEKYRYFDSGKGRYPPTREIVSTGMDVEVAIFRVLAREQKVVYCDDGEETNMDCGNLHFRNNVFPKTASSSSSEEGSGGGDDDSDDVDGAESDKLEEDNPALDAEDEEEQEEKESEDDDNDAPSNGWADLV